MSPDRKDAYTFPSAVSALMDVQAVCEVQNILVLVRKSIGSANPVGVVTDPVLASAALVKARLGDLLLGGAPLSTDQFEELILAIRLFTISHTRAAPEDSGSIEGLESATSQIEWRS